MFVIMNCVCTATQGELAPQVFSFTQTQSENMSVFRACMRFRWRRNCVCCPSASSSSSSSENSLSLRDRETTGSDCCFFFGWHRQLVPEQKALLAAVSRRELAGKKMQPHLRCQVSAGQSRRCWISRATPAIYRCTYSSRDFKLFKRSFKKSKSLKKLKTAPRNACEWMYQRILMIIKADSEWLGVLNLQQPTTTTLEIVPTNVFIGGFNQCHASCCIQIVVVW